MSETPYTPKHERDRLRGEITTLGSTLSKRAWELCQVDAQMREIPIPLPMQQAAKWGIEHAITVVLDYLRTAEYGLVPLEQIKPDQTSFAPKPYPFLRGNLMPPEEPLDHEEPDGPTVNNTPQPDPASESEES